MQHGEAVHSVAIQTVHWFVYTALLPWFHGHGRVDSRLTSQLPDCVYYMRELRIWILREWWQTLTAGFTGLFNVMTYQQTAPAVPPAGLPSSMPPVCDS